MDSRLNAIIFDVNQGRRAWFVWPLLTLVWCLVHYRVLAVAMPSHVLIVLYATHISGRWAGLSVAAIGSAYAAFLFGFENWYRIMWVSLILFSVVPSPSILRHFARRSNARLEELNGNLTKLRGALVDIDLILTNNTIDKAAADRLILARDKIATLLTVAGLWVEFSRAKARDITRWERENEEARRRDS